MIRYYHPQGTSSRAICAPPPSPRLAMPRSRASSRWTWPIWRASRTRSTPRSTCKRSSARISELVRAVIPYRIFAIFLLNDRTHELRMRLQIGHTPQAERTRIPVGQGVVGQVALTRQPILLNDVSTADYYVDANPAVRSELAIPLIAKNRLIGVMDIESEQQDFFRPEHLHVLNLTASRMAQSIENARLYLASPARRRRSKCSTRLQSSWLRFSNSSPCWSASASSCAASSITRCSRSCCSTKKATR